MDWVQGTVSIVSAVSGGFVGGWVVAFRMGRWRQRVEDRLEVVEGRLANGDPHVDAVPVLRAQVDVVLKEIRDLKEMNREAFRHFQTKEICQEKHRALERSH